MVTYDTGVKILRYNLTSELEKDPPEFEEEGPTEEKENSVESRDK